mmetsp:Transcript_4556/g.18764  ORF Transcript_4556/g.18764 Transcript_4556/m.18764 type:complete len:777 (+) Transcript_4556:621-2951(+)
MFVCRFTGSPLDRCRRHLALAVLFRPRGEETKSANLSVVTPPRVAVQRIHRLLGKGVQRRVSRDTLHLLRQGFSLRDKVPVKRRSAAADTFLLVHPLVVLKLLERDPLALLVLRVRRDVTHAHEPVLVRVEHRAVLLFHGLGDSKPGYVRRGVELRRVPVLVKLEPQTVLKLAHVPVKGDVASRSLPRLPHPRGDRRARRRVDRAGAERNVPRGPTPAGRTTARTDTRARSSPTTRSRRRVGETAEAGSPTGGAPSPRRAARARRLQPLRRSSVEAKVRGAGPGDRLAARRVSTDGRRRRTARPASDAVVRRSPVPVPGRSSSDKRVRPSGSNLRGDGGRGVHRGLLLREHLVVHVNHRELDDVRLGLGLRLGLGRFGGFGGFGVRRLGGRGGGFRALAAGSARHRDRHGVETTLELPPAEHRDRRRRLLRRAHRENRRRARAVGVPQLDPRDVPKRSEDLRHLLRVQTRGRALDVNGDALPRGGAPSIAESQPLVPLGLPREPLLVPRLPRRFPRRAFLPRLLPSPAPVRERRRLLRLGQRDAHLERRRRGACAVAAELDPAQRRRRGRRVFLRLEPDEAVRRPFDVGDVLGEEDVAVLAEEIGEFGGAKVGRKVSHEQILGLVPSTSGGGTAAPLAPSFARGRVGVGARGVARADEVRYELLPPRGVVLSVARRPTIAVPANRRRRRRRPRVGLGRGRVVRDVPHRRFDLRDGGVGAGGVFFVVAALVPVVGARRSTRAKPNERRTRSAVGALAEDPGAARGEDATRRTECDAT